MIFDSYHIELIARRKKTQTRRVVKADVQNQWQIGRDYAVCPGRGRPAARWAVNKYDHDVIILPDRTWWGIDGESKNLTVWDVARTTAFSSTGKPNPEMFLLNEVGPPLRIRITAIRREKLHDISPDDVRAEGVRHDQDVDLLDIGFDEWEEELRIYRDIWNDINTRKGTRWQDNPDVWVLEFEAVRR